MVNYFELIKTPRKFFKSVEEETILDTIKRVTIPLIFFITILLFLSNHTLAYIETITGLKPVSNLALQIVLSIIFLSFSIIISAALIQLGLMILKIKSKFRQTIKAIIYPTVFISAFMILIQLILLITPILIARFIIYIITAIILFIWSAILTIVGLSELNKTSIRKAVGAYFLSLALIIGIYIMISIIFTALNILGLV